MKNISLFILTFGLSLASFGQNRCHTDEYLEHLVQENPELLVKKAEQDKAFRSFLENKSQLKQSSGPGDIVNIPVVFHVLYRNNVQNIPDARIYEQIDRLNKDYSATNTDTSTVPAEFKPFISDTKIRFLLASEDPDGNPTTGITRTSTTNYSFDVNLDDIKYNSTGGHDAWSPDDYLNIWIGNISSGILGYATPPYNAGNNSDGVVIGYNFVGNSSSGAYNKGRTATHEVGHYLGLEHVWGTGGCSSDDGINDTPDQSGPNYGIPVHPSPSCSSNDMFMNYMDYGNDEVLVMYTLDQKTRMEYALDVLRNGLAKPEPVGIKESTPNLISLYPNPATDIVNVTFKDHLNHGTLSIIDIAGRVYQTLEVENTNQLTLDVSQLIEGLYFIQFKNNHQNVQQKIVIK